MLLWNSSKKGAPMRFMRVKWRNKTTGETGQGNPVPQSSLKLIMYLVLWAQNEYPYLEHWIEETDTPH